MASELIVRIGAESKEFSDELNKVKKETVELEKQLATVAKISGAAFAAGTVAIGAATNAAAKFESKFTNVVTLLDKGSFSSKTLNDGINDLKQGVLDLGAETGESFDSLNQGLFDLISAGVPAEKAIDTLRATTELAAAGATDTATAVKAITSVLTAFGEEAGTANEISEKFFTAQKFGVTTVGELASEFNKVAGLAKNLGVSFDESLASLSALTADGAKPTAEAATQLRAALNGIINVQQNLGKESKAVQEALSLQNLEQNGLVAALQDLKAATGGSIAEQKRLLGSSEALQAVLSLTGAQAELVATQTKAMADEQQRAAVFAEALAVKNETTERALNRAGRSFEQLAITIGEKFAPLINLAADALANLTRFLAENQVFAEFAALILGVGTALAGLVAAAALASSAFLKIRAAMIALNISTKVLSLGIKGLVGATGIGLLVIAAQFVFENWGKIWPATVKIFSAVVETLKTLASGIGDILIGIFTLDSDKISEGINKAKDATVKGIQDVVKAAQGEADKDPVTIPVNVDSPSGDVETDSVSTGSSAPARGGSGVESFKQKEKEKTDFLNEEQKRRIAVAKGNLDRLRALQNGASEEELEFAKRKNELLIREQQAQSEQNAEVRNAELELIRAEREQALAEEAEFLQQRDEQKRALEEEFRALDDEEKAALNERDIEELTTQIQTKDDIEREFAKEKAQRNIRNRNQFLRDERRFGTQVAQLNEFFRKEEVQGAANAANQLVKLQSSKNNTLKSIGKAAGVAQIAIDTAKGAIAAYSSLAGIPIVGPALGIAAAGALIAFGAEQTSAILAANEGGRVPSSLGIPGVDSVPSLLTPGELVVPEKNFDEVINSVASQRSSDSPDLGSSLTEGEEGGAGTMVLEIDLKERAGEVITLEQREGRTLGLINRNE